MLVGSGSNAPNRLWAPDPAMHAVLDSVPNALAILDEHGQIAYCNAAWTALGARTSGYGDLGTLVTSHDKEGSPYVRRLAALDGPLALPAHRLARAAQDLLAGHGRETRLPYRMRRPEGEEPFEALLVPVPAAKGRAVAIHHLDLSERERAADADAVALEKALQVEEAASRQRRLARRMAALGRDLHTPITPVRLELHLLRSGAFGPLTPAQAKAIDLAHRNIQRWADREAEFQDLPAEPPAVAADLDLAAFALEVTEARQTEALQKGIRLSLPARRGPVPVHASPDAIRDALDRFLDHALTSTPADSIVAVEVHERDGQAMLAVIDSGGSLSARELRMAFDPWGGRRPAAGASLSLHVARLAIEKAGGRAFAECDGPGQGLVLGFALPLLSGPSSARGPAGRPT